ncbi:MAG: 2-amino-4-hydroxy-6-hydroxymethyldihydropteridine diphosphokinase [Solirubrobacterales bacterium]|nr:2-amino-4-hydroxy-6-hydroxymethyldihydropteridine diphosphokinase [Solirubrobacterales bacterium]
MSQPTVDAGRDDGPVESRVVFLGLGSNIGDRHGYLNQAIDRLLGAGIEVEAVSSGWETAPVGLILDQPDFLNAAVRIRTPLEPEELLDLLKEIERAIGRRTGRPRHSPRVIDIDLLLMGDLEYESDRLRLPHREVTSRRFVLAPLLELDPGLTLPDGVRLADAMAALEAEVEETGENQTVSNTGPLRDS